MHRITQTYLTSLYLYDNHFMGTEPDRICNLDIDRNIALCCDTCDNRLYFSYPTCIENYLGG